MTYDFYDPFFQGIVHALCKLSRKGKRSPKYMRKFPTFNAKIIKLGSIHMIHFSLWNAYDDKVVSNDWLLQ